MSRNPQASVRKDEDHWQPEPSDDPPSGPALTLMPPFGERWLAWHVAAAHLVVGELTARQRELQNSVKSIAGLWLWPYLCIDPATTGKLEQLARSWFELLTAPSTALARPSNGHPPARKMPKPQAPAQRPQTADSERRASAVVFNFPERRVKR